MPDGRAALRGMLLAFERLVHGEDADEGYVGCTNPVCALHREQVTRLLELLAELVRAVEAERPSLYVQTARGRIVLDSWDGAVNDFGDRFVAALVEVVHSLAVREALREAHEVLDHAGDRAEEEGGDAG
ncbi:MAG TPA: hypothetical protein VNO79_10620 [Actinomycetota bacterium]|nr:hypothetical protein [Actinomycetota bacterium]